MADGIVDRLIEILAGIFVLYVIWEVVKQLSASSPGFGQYALPIFVAAAAALLLYARSQS